MLISKLKQTSDPKAVQALKAYYKWELRQYRQGKSSLISEKDKEIFVSRHNLTLEEFKSIIETGNGI